MKTAFFRIAEGKIKNEQTIIDAFVGLTDGAYELKITKRNRRSLSQNAYYWSCVVPLVQEGLQNLGHDVTIQETHEFLKYKFNSKELINEETGEVVAVPKSTTELNKEQFGNYIEKIQQFSIEWLNVNIPSPNQQAKIFEIDPPHPKLVSR